jgi:cytochrome b
MNFITKIQCLLIGWNPKILTNCREVSYATLRRYVAAIIILSIIWGIIGWNFADNYLAITSWYGKTITSLVFITVIVCIERFIIMSHGKLTVVRVFRIFLALLMAVLGSTIFDQIIFKNDIDVRMKEVRTEQINTEIPKRTMLIDNEIKEIFSTIDSITVINKTLYDDLIKSPVIIIPEVTTTRRQAGKDSVGNPIYENDRMVTQRSVPNPKTEQVQKNEDLLKEYRDRGKALQDRRLNVASEVRTEYERVDTGFLEELGALYSLLGENWVMLAFYIFLFLFLTCLELLVITTKGIERCDYEILLDFQLNQRRKEFDSLDKN